MLNVKNKKFQISLIILIIIAFIFVDKVLNKEINNLTNSKYTATSKNLKDLLSQAIKDKSLGTKNLALALSENRSFKDFLKGNKQLDIDLQKVSLKIRQNSNYKNVWIHLVDKNGISRYRSWTKKRGDNVAIKRKELPSLLKNPKLSSIISVGLFDMTFKSIVPIYEEDKFLGLIEVITKTNSIAKKFEENGLDLVILVDKKYKKLIKKPFTKEFINDYYIANINAKKELKQIIKKDLDKYISKKPYHLTNKYLVTTYFQNDVFDEKMGYFIIFENLKDINTEDIDNFKFFIQITGILLFIILLFFIVAIYFYNKSKYTKELEKSVKTRTKKLNELTKRYKQIFEDSKAIKFIVDPKNGQIVEINQAALDFYGFTKEKFKKMFLDEISILPKNEIFKNFTKVIKAKQNKFVIKHKLANGEIKDVEVYSSCVQIDKKNYIYSIIRDITDELKAKKELEEKQKLLYQQSKMASMGEMLENIAHQWRQPLSTITTAASGAKVKKEFGQLDDEFFFDSIDLIVKSSNYLSQTIEDFRDFFKQSKEKENFDIVDIINHSIKISNLPKDIIIDLKTENITINGYKNEFIQVLLNLINNSKDAFKTRKIKDKIIKIKIKKINNDIVFTFFDNAGGIDEDKLEKIFEPYYTTKHKSQGTGIGLYMSEQIIVKHFKGHMSVNNLHFNYKGKDYFGAYFKIVIPLSL